MKPVLLIFPGKKKEQPHIPLSILTLAAYLREHNVAVEILDARISDYKDLCFERYLLVGLSVIVEERAKAAYEITSYIKQRFPKAIVVWGGPLPSCNPEVICQSDLVDIVVRKEGEGTLLELADCLSKNKPLEDVKGITFKKDGIVISNPDRPFLDMDTLPLPAYDLLELNKYINGTNCIEMETSRGCPHDCVFCCSPRLHNLLWRAKSVKKLVGEIECLIKKFSVRNFFFWDSNFFVDKRRVLSFCDATIKRRLGIKWTAYMRADNLAGYTNEEIAVMKRAGLNFLCIGAESGSQAVLDSLGKNSKVSDITAAVSKCAKYDIRLSLSFMIGAPIETLKDIKETMKLCEQIKKLHPLADIKEYRIIKLYPGSRLYDKYNHYDSFKTLEDIIFYEPSDYGSYKWLDRAQIKRIVTIIRITAFFYMHNLFRNRGEASQKKILGSAKNIFLWKLLFPLINLDALFRWKTAFFYFGYEWSLLSYVAKKTLTQKVGQF